MCWYLTTTEVPAVEGEVILAIRALADCGVGSKAIARALGVARNTVRRYLRQSSAETDQVRPAARRRTDDRRLEAWTLYEGPAGGNAVVVQRLLAARGLTVSDRTIERAVARWRTCDASDRWLSWRRFASKRRRATSYKSISARSVCRSRAPTCAFSCWLRS